MSDDFRLLIFDLEEIGEIAGDKRLAEDLAGGGDGGEVLEAIGEAGEDLADLVDERCRLERQTGLFILDPRLPKTLGLEIIERIFRRVLVVVFPNQTEAGGESVAEFPAPRDAFGSGDTFVDEIESGEQEQRLVRTFVRTPLLHRCRARMEVIEPVDGLVGIHDRRQALWLID